MNDSKSGYGIKTYNQPTKRYCQTLNLRDSKELIDAYRRLHSREGIWQEILDGIKSVGILEMEIYLSGTTLTMIVETPIDFDWAKSMALLSTLPRQAEWEDLTSKYQNATSGQTSDQKWHMMERIFYLYD